ncbi:hypothetical protein [Pseudomonas sp. Teo4]|uniref:hypothetical protein n=1 Tax=Pseudomonas sp. Teo4 TaxID=3064528 RepID=UPI002ACB125C|nr:hypothetical protein [Pseudomonas sp. Teo4]
MQFVCTVVARKAAVLCAACVTTVHPSTALQHLAFKATGANAKLKYKSLFLLVFLNGTAPAIEELSV